MDQDSLEWLSSYLEGWTQYVVVESSKSRSRKMIRGAPQGVGLSPILWRSSTNDIPEAGLIDMGLQHQSDTPSSLVGQPARTPEGQAGQVAKDVISEQIDMKRVDELTTEEKLDQG